MGLDTKGIRIGDADGQLYIVDSEKHCREDPWIEIIIMTGAMVAINLR